MPIDAADPKAATSHVPASQSTLEVIRLPAGQGEPEGEDCVQIARFPSGGYQFSGTVSIHSEDVVAGSATSISDAGGADGPFPDADAAEAAAVEWAAEQGAETLYVLTADE